MMESYLGVVCGEPGKFGIFFRDFPGCFSLAETLDTLFVSGGEALAGHIEAMQEDGYAIPPPTDHSLADALAWLNEADGSSDENWFGPFSISVDVKPPAHSSVSSVELVPPKERSDPDSASFREFMRNLRRIRPVLRKRSTKDG